MVGSSASYSCVGVTCVVDVIIPEGGDEIGPVYKQLLPQSPQS